MFRRFILGGMALSLALPLATRLAAAGEEKSVLDFKVKNIDGKDVNLADYKGKVILVVNVASKCGLTPQYKGLEELYEKYKDKGFVILGFPANEFGSQEPGTDSEIKQFCSLNYNVKFPMFSKIVVKGEGIHPLYQFLTSDKTNPKFAGDIKWNFNKFLVDRQGNVIARFEPKTTPEECEKTIEAALSAK
jgi:glutathione peroxidase